MKEIKFNKNNLFTDCNDIDISNVSASGMYALLFDVPSTTYFVTPLSAASGIGAAVVPVVRTNNPTIGANDVNENISALDAAIGVTVIPEARTVNRPISASASVNDNIMSLDEAIGLDVIPVVRTNHPTLTTNSLSANITALDNAIGVTPTSTNVIVAADSVNQNLSLLDTAVQALSAGTTATKVISKTVGAPGVAGCNFNFTSAANTTAQNIDLGAIVPAFSRIIDVAVICTSASVFSGGGTTLVASLGNVTGGTQFSASHTIYAVNAINADGLAMSAPVSINSSASHVWLSGATPGANWSTMTAGVYTVYVTYVTY